MITHRPLRASFLGFDRFLQEFEDALGSASAAIPSFPPFDIYREGDLTIVDMAVAGYRRDQVTIEHDRKNGYLHIRGDNTPPPTVVPTEESTSTEVVAPSREVVRQGIARRAFTRSFRIADDHVVQSASLEEGMLTIKLVRVVTEADKPLLIPIA